MTLSHTTAGKGARAVSTNGLGQRTTGHLNLTVTMEAQISADIAQVKLSSPRRYQRYERQPRIPYAGRE